MPHILDVGSCSPSHIAAFWGIADPAAVKARTAKPAPRAARPAAARPPLGLAAAPQVEISGVKKVIEDALRAAGLMR